MTSQLFIVYIMFMCRCYIYVMALCLCLSYSQPHTTIFMCPFEAYQCYECTSYDEKSHAFAFSLRYDCRFMLRLDLLIFMLLFN